jgi:hypothetical protein
MDSVAEIMHLTWMKCQYHVRSIWFQVLLVHVFYYMLDWQVVTCRSNSGWTNSKPTKLSAIATWSLLLLVQRVTADSRPLQDTKRHNLKY